MFVTPRIVGWKTGGDCMSKIDMLLNAWVILLKQPVIFCLVVFAILGAITLIFNKLKYL